MDGNNKDNSTHQDISSPVEFEQPRVFAAPDNTPLGDYGRSHGRNNDAAVLNPAESKVEEIVGTKGTGDHQFGFTDGQVSSVSVDNERSEREVNLESNESESSPLTKVVKVTENVTTDTPSSVDEVAAGFSESGGNSNGDKMEVDPSGKNNKSADKPVSLDNQKRQESSTNDGGEIMYLKLEDATEKSDDGSLQRDLRLDVTDKEENGQVVSEALSKANHVDEVALESSENNEIDDAVSSTENTILQKSNILQTEESVDSNVEGKLGCSASEAPSANVSAGLGQAHGRNVIDTVSDIKRDNVTDRFGNSVSENGPRETVTEELLKEGEIKQAEKKQDTLNFIEHVEELDYEEEDGGGRPEKLEKQDQENTRDGQSDKDESELTDDDCEEGEIKEPGSKKMFVKPLCRFFQRGSCSWGVGCRFLHPGVNDKGNYQLIEMPGSAPAGVRSRLGVPSMWPELGEGTRPPPPPIPEIPLVETAWERGLRLAKERKKAAERKEKESDFEDKRLNLSVDKEWEVNKENERLPVVTVKDPYYDQAEYEVDEYYKVAREPWPAGHYENNQVRYNQDTAYSPAYRDKPPVTTSARYDHLYGPPEDKFQQERLGLQEPVRLEGASLKRPDEWTDPWSRTKSPKATKRKAHRTSRGKRKRRSASDDSNSSRSRSRSSGSSRSSRSYSSSSGSSSRSRSAETGQPGLGKRGRYLSPSRDLPRSSTSARGQDAHLGYYQNNRGHGRYQRGGYHVSNGGGYYSNSYGGGNIGPAGGYAERNVRDRSRDRTWNARGRSPPDRPLPYARPRPKSASSNSDSSRSRSRSRIRISSSRSRSSSRSSRSSSSSSSSAGSADSNHLYRDLGNPSKNPQTPSSGKKSKTKNRTSNGPHFPALPVSLPAFRLDQIPTPQDPQPPPPLPGKAEPKYASRNAPLPPVRAKDPLKIVGQKSNIKLTLLPKTSLGSRPNPLDSPPHKRQIDSDISSPESLPPAKRPNPAPEASVWRQASEKAAKLQFRTAVDPLPVHVPSSSSPSSASSSPGVPQVKATTLPQKPQVKATTLPQKPQAGRVKPRTMELSVAKPAPKAPAANKPAATAAVAKPKKTAVSRREELLKQLKAVEDAIAKKKGQVP